MGYFDDMPTSSVSPFADMPSSAFADMPSDSLWDKTKKIASDVGDTLSDIGLGMSADAKAQSEGVTAARGTLGSVGSGAVSWMPAGVRMVAGQLNPGAVSEYTGVSEIPRKPESLEQSSKAALALMDEYTYEPKTEAGKQLTELAMTPLTAVSEKFEEGALYSEKKYKEALDKGDQETADRWNAMIGVARFGKDSWMFALPLVFKGIKGIKESASLKGLGKDIIPETQGKPYSITSDVKPTVEAKPKVEPVDNLIDSLQPREPLKIVPKVPVELKPIIDKIDTKIEQIKTAKVSQIGKETAINALEMIRKQQLLTEATAKAQKANVPPEPQGIVEPTPTSQAVAPKIEEPLLTEARKYKTAEEFWKADHTLPLDSLSPASTYKEWLKEPGGGLPSTEPNKPIVVIMKDGKNLIADGVHRYYEHLQSGKKDIKVVYSKSQLTDIWNKAQEGVPKEVKLETKLNEVAKEPVAEVPKPSILDDINTIMGGERGSISTKGFTPEQLAAKARLDEVYNRFASEAKAAGKELGEYLKEIGRSQKEISYFTARDKETPKVGIKIEPPEVKPEVGKERGLAKNTEAEAIRAELINERGELGDLPTYIERDPKLAQEKVTQILDNNVDQAWRIIEGKEKPPADIFPEDVFTGMRVRAEINGDVNTITKLLDSPLVSEATKLGQRIQALYTANADSPFVVLKGIIKERTESMKKQGKEPVSSAKVAKLEKELADKQKAFDDYVAKVEELKANSAIDEMVKPKYEPVGKPKIKYGSQNKIVTEELYLKAKASLREKFAQHNVGLDPTIIKDLTEVGAYHLEAGTRSFANWSAKVIEDVGDWAKPHLEDIYKQVKANANKITSETFAKKVDKALKEGKDTPEIGMLVQKLARQLVAEGINERTALVKEVHSIIKEVIPDITLRETADAISGYGKYKQLSKDEISVKLRDIKGQLQQISKIEDLQKKGVAQKTGVERRIPSDVERDLIKQVDEAKKKYGIETVDPETQLRTKNETLKTRLINETKDLKQKLIDMNLTKKEKTVSQPTAENLKLKEERDIAKKNLKVAQDATVAPTKEQIKKLIELSQEVTKTKAEMEKGGEFYKDNVEKYRVASGLYENYINELRSEYKTFGEKAKNVGSEILGLSRAIKTSGDLSAVLRQGAFVVLGHPIRGLKAMPSMFKALRSEKGQFLVEQEIKHRPTYQLMDKSGLYLSEHGSKLSKMEEAYMSHWGEKIPGVAASGRAYTTYLNRLRADTFDTMIKKLPTVEGKPTPIELEAISNFINVATGRGKMSAGKSLEILNGVFFAPRYVLSRFQLMSGQPLVGGTLATKGMILKEYARFLTGLGVVYAVATLAGGKVETSPDSILSGDYGKIKFGKTRIDPMAGLSQTSTFASRAISGETKKGNERPEKLKGYKYWELYSRFARTKLAPIPGLIVDVQAGEDLAGQKIKPVGTVKDFMEGKSIPSKLVMPLALSDIYQTMVEQGVPKGSVMALLSIFGMGMQTYDTRR